MDPIFITGLHKSGTTWLANLLSGHPEVYVNFEAGFFDHQELLSTPGRKLQNQPDDESLEYIVFHYIERWGNKPWNNWLNDLDHNQILRKLFITLVTSIIENVAQRMKPQARLWVDKTPRTEIRRILDFFPSAKIIYMMRDGRDRAISLYYHCRRTEPEVIEAQKGLRRMNWDEIYRSWVYDIQLNEVYFSHPACLLVRYEDLLLDTPAEIGRILDFLDIRRDAELYEQVTAAASFETMSNGRKPGQEDTESFFRKGICGDWHTFPMREKIELFNAICMEIAVKYGYAMDVHNEVEGI